MSTLTVNNYHTTSGEGRQLHIDDWERGISLEVRQRDHTLITGLTITGDDAQQIRDFFQKPAPAIPARFLDYVDEWARHERARLALIDIKADGSTTYATTELNAEYAAHTIAKQLTIHLAPDLAALLGITEE